MVGKQWKQLKQLEIQLEKMTVHGRRVAKPSENILQKIVSVYLANRDVQTAGFYRRLAAIEVFM